MKTIEKVKQYIAAVEAIEKSEKMLYEKEAAIYCNCSAKTLSRWRDKMGVRSIRFSSVRWYMKHDLERIKLAREYAIPIRAFKKMKI